MAKRIITSAIGLIVFFATFFANEHIFSAAVMIVTIGLVYEAVSAIKPGKTVTAVSMIFSLLVFLGGIFLETMGRDIALFTRDYGFSGIALITFFLLCILLMIFIYLVLAVAKFGKVEFQKIFSAAFLTAYITAFMFFIVLLRAFIGRYAVIPVFIFSWITDTGAYFVGSFMGKHKLCKNLSPKKTVEGAIGGIITTVLGAYIYTLILKYAFSITIPSVWFFVAAAAFGAVLSELGDLAASAVKRQSGIKDFGKIFPGHGGFMDRFDSVVFVAPYTYLIFIIMNMIWH